MATYDVRPAEPSDLTQVYAIYEHYIVNTVTNFYHKTPPKSKVESGYEAAKEKGLPYLVAVEREPGPNNEAIVLGYAYASAFRQPKLSYAPTVEITIFVHPSHQSRGVGSRLMAALLGELQHVTLHPVEPGHEDQSHNTTVKSVLAIMAYDANGPGKENADKLKAWYQKLGFELVGHLKNVGWKYDRWIDTMYLQLQLDEWREKSKTK